MRIASRICWYHAAAIRIMPFRRYPCSIHASTSIAAHVLLSYRMVAAFSHRAFFGIDNAWRPHLS
jgi:hypothetical protein